ncbi:MAG: hypothetical protein ACR2GH_03450 [Pseudonocardia sp.]
MPPCPLCWRLPELLRHLYVYWAQSPRGERGRELLAMLLDDAYALAATAIFRFGYLDLAEQVDDRRTLIAAVTGDPLRVAGAAYGRTRLPLHRGDHGGCTRRLDGALDLISDLPGETARAPTTPTPISLRPATSSPPVCRRGRSAGSTARRSTPTASTWPSRSSWPTAPPPPPPPSPALNRCTSAPMTSSVTGSVTTGSPSLARGCCTATAPSRSRLGRHHPLIVCFHATARMMVSVTGA